MQTDIEITLDSPDLPAVLADERECVSRIQFLWGAADIIPGLPATTATVAELLRVGGGYDASTALLEGWSRDKKVDVAIRSGRFAWTARAILSAMVLLDTWRRFAPLDRRHLHKLHASELIEQQARLAGETGFSDLATFDVNAIIEIVSRCTDAGLRKTFCTALKAKLRQIDPGILDR